MVFWAKYRSDLGGRAKSELRPRWESKVGIPTCRAGGAPGRLLCRAGGAAGWRTRSAKPPPCDRLGGLAWLRCRIEASTLGKLARMTRRQRVGPRRRADGVFFSPLTRPAVNPVTQDCSTQSWRERRIAPPESCTGHRIAPLNPVLCAGLPRCLPENCGSVLLYSRALPENSGSAPLYSDALPHSPPGFPASNVGSNCFLRQSIAVSSPLTPWCPWCHARAFSSGHQNRAKPWL